MKSAKLSITIEDELIILCTSPRLFSADFVGQDVNRLFYLFETITLKGVKKLARSSIRMMWGHEMEISNKWLWYFRKPSPYRVDSSFQQVRINQAGGWKPAREEGLKALNFPLLQAFI